MKNDDAFRTRGVALEEEFYRRANAELLSQLRAARQLALDAATLKSETGITDDELIQEFLSLGIRAGTIRALLLVPTIHVAWANGFLERAEREAVIRAAASLGIAASSPSGQMLLSWLEHPAKPELLHAWQGYVTALRDLLKPDSFARLRARTVETARQVAEAAGGFLGVHAVSVSEERAIREIEDFFHQD